MKTARLIAIGTELTTGQSIDTNSAWLAQRLAERGIRVVAHACVSDDQPAIVETFQTAAARSDLVISTGGLGPTDDDLTRAALAEAAGCDLVEDSASLAMLRQYFAARMREMPERNRIQAQIPRTGNAIPNRCGTAPGVHLRIGNTPIFSLPGVPYEMKAMFEQGVLPSLPTDLDAVIRVRVLRTMGFPEAGVNDILGTMLMRGTNPEVGTSAALGEIGIRIVAHGSDITAADALLDQTERQVRDRLGWAVFGRDTDTLASVVGEFLRSRSARVAVAESCTGGMLGARLTEVAGCSDYFQGGVISYANDVKISSLGVPEAVIAEHGAVSAETAIAMAVGVRERTRADYSLSITGIAGPGGGTREKPVGLVYIGLADRAGGRAIRCLFGDDQPREVIRARACGTALNSLRLALQYPEFLEKQLERKN